MSVKDHQYFLENPAELDTLSEDQYAQLEKDGFLKDASQVDPAENAPDVKADDTLADTEAAPAKDAKPEPELNADNAVVKTRDGKHEIPYSVLDKARREADEATQLATQQAEQLAQLQQQLIALQQAQPTSEAAQTRNDQQQAEVTADMEAVKAELIEEFGATAAERLIKLTEATTAKSQRLEQAVSALLQDRQQVMQESMSQLQQQVVAVEAANPALAYWKEASPELYDAAIREDKVLRSDPKWAKAALDPEQLAKRFDIAVKRVVAEYGDAVLPATVRQQMNGKPTKSVTDQAKDKLNGLPKPAIRTLSDITGGEGTAQTDGEAVDSASPQVLYERFRGKDPMAIFAEAARLARNS